MDNKVYLVYSFSYESPDAVCLDRGVANEIAKFLELNTGKEYWVAVEDLAETLEQFKEGY